jgi:hypothetical protein
VGPKGDAVGQRVFRWMRSAANGVSEHRNRLGRARDGFAVVRESGALS